MYRTSDPVATEYTRRIAEEARAKEAERQAQRAAEEQARRREVAGLPALRSPKHHVEVEPLEQFRQQARVEEKVHELEAFGSSSSPTSGSPPSYHTTSSSTDEISSEQCHSSSGNDAIQGLRADLERERSQIQRLEEEVRQAKHEIASLTSQREADQIEYIQALRAQNYGYAAELHNHLQALHHQLESAWADRRKLENDLEEGRSREEVLRRQLRDARSEAKKLEDQIGTEAKRKNSRGGKYTQGIRVKERKAMRQISSKQDRNAIRVEYAEYEIQPQISGSGCCLVM
ncbi:hypothetical protein MMC30_006806 [Trapelia coarctata]|nr:hypothetical protein [Trapelia coarctata]